MRPRLTAPILVCLILFVGCTTPEQKAATDAAAIATAKQQVEKRMTDFSAVLPANDWKSMKTFWVQDPQIFETGMEVKGKAAFDALIDGIAATMNITAFDFTISELFVHDGATVAYQYGHYTEVVASKDGKTKPTTSHNNTVLRWVKEADGVWRISRLTATPMPSEAPTPAKK